MELVTKKKLYATYNCIGQIYQITLV